MENSEKIQDRLTRLGDQVYQDGIIVADLKWRMAEIQDLEERAKTAGKRSYKKARGKAPTHRYPTRYSGSQADEILQLGKKEYGDVDSRIKAVEERMEEMKKEKEQLETELEKMAALAPKIDTLTASLNDFKMSQLKINLGAFQEFTHLRQFYTNAVAPKLDAHSRDIAGLNARYTAIYSLVIKLLNPQPNGRKTPASRQQKPIPPMNVSMPIPPSPLRATAVAM